MREILKEGRNGTAERGKRGQDRKERRVEGLLKEGKGWKGNIYWGGTEGNRRQGREMYDMLKELLKEKEGKRRGRGQDCLLWDIEGKR